MAVNKLGPYTSVHDQRLVLLGGGPSHLQLLRKFAAHPVPGQQITLVAQTPDWLQRSGLAVSTAGDLVTDNCLRSSSHPDVFLPGVEPGRPSGEWLPANLVLLRSGAAPRACTWQGPRLQFVALGQRRAIASRGARSTQGYRAWRWKDWLERRQSAATA